VNSNRSSVVDRHATIPKCSVYHQQTAQWIEDEFSSVDLGDERLNRRLLSIIQSFCSQPDASIPQATGSWDKTKGAYRFMDNPKATPVKILKPHCEATTSRIREEKVVLVPQDTTYLNFTHHPETEGLGTIATDPNLRGMLVHSTLAFTPQRTPLGLIGQQTWIRPVEEYGKKHQRYEKSIHQKESRKWLASLQATEEIQKETPGTLLINIGDREADIYELFLQANSYHCHLLVRGSWDRRVEHPEKYLWSYLEAQPRAATLSVTIPRKEKKPERLATVEIRFAPVTLRAPRNNRSSVPFLQIWAIYVNEPSPPDGEEPLSWLLLTTLKVESIEEAIRYVEYYAVRFSIELFHKVLKSGCKIEKYQLKTAERLIRCLAIDSVVAWRVMFLTMMGRAVPDLPSTVLFEEHEWKSLYCFAHQVQKPPQDPPPLGEAVGLVAQLGGFLGRKSDGHPGVQVLWRGMKILSVISGAWTAFGPESNLAPRAP
jgi:hypothetical protein